MARRPGAALIVVNFVGFFSAAATREPSPAPFVSIDPKADAR
jgi:hypothetical protein